MEKVVHWAFHVEYRLIVAAIVGLPLILKLFIQFQILIGHEGQPRTKRKVWIVTMDGT